MSVYHVDRPDIGNLIEQGFMLPSTPGTVECPIPGIPNQKVVTPPVFQAEAETVPVTVQS